MNFSIILFNEEKSKQTAILLNSAIIVYSNADTDKLQILTENKGKAGIYLWTHTLSGKKYVGSAIDLSKRLEDYYKLSYISDKSKGNSYIYNAIISHGYSAFSLTILEYIDISNVSIDEARELILLREQHYLDSFAPEYNIQLIAGSPLGVKRSEETIAKMKAIRLGANNPMHGKNHSVETRAKISESLFGKVHSAETKSKISIARGTAIYVYSFDKSTLVNTFISARKASEHFNCNHITIINYTKSGKIFKKQWILSTSLISELS
jgi:group I intron endonuclease